MLQQQINQIRRFNSNAQTPDSVITRVIIAEDEEIVRESIKELLESWGVDIVAEATNGIEAVKAYDNYQPDLLFMDIMMPEKDGIDALKDIIGKNPTAKITMLTAISDISVADSCVEAGAQGYIRKGASPGVFKLLLKAQIDSVKATN